MFCLETFGSRNLCGYHLAHKHCCRPRALWQQHSLMHAPKQENAPCHTTKPAQEWPEKSDKKLEELIQPPNSPDPNPIKHLGDVLDQVWPAEAPSWIRPCFDPSSPGRRTSGAVLWWLAPGHWQWIPRVLWVVTWGLLGQASPMHAWLDWDLGSLGRCLELFVKFFGTFWNSLRSSHKCDEVNVFPAEHCIARRWSMWFTSPVSGFIHLYSYSFYFMADHCMCSEQIKTTPSSSKVMAPYLSQSFF